MANTTIRLKKSGVVSNVPSSLDLGELALNYADGKLYYKNASGVITYISSGATTNSFATINSNSSLILATSNTDILTLVGSNNITINTNTGTKTITIGANLTDSLSTNSSNIGASANAAAQLYNLVTTAQGVAAYAANQANYLTAYSNAAYAQANTATNLAQLAFNKANTGGGGSSNTTNFNYLTVQKQLYTANASQTNFFINYTPPYVTVVINGSTIDSSEYSTGTANTVILTNPATANDIVDITGFSVANSALLMGTGIDQYARNTANGANSFVTSGGTINGNVAINGSLSVTGNITYTGNVTTQVISGNTGQFFGYTSNGFNALYAGIPTGYFVEPQVTFQMSSNFNGYSGLNMQNINSGANSSSDLFITSDNGTINDGYLDIGFASSNYNYPGYNLIGKNDGYLFATGNTTTGGGNMIIGTGLSNDVIFATGGINTTNEVMRITRANNVLIKSNTKSTSNTTGSLILSGGLGVAGNVYADKIYVNGLFWAANGNVISTGGSSGPTGTNQFTIYKYVASFTGQTTFAGTDTQTAFMAYTPGAIIVTLNGITLKPGTDFTATDGTTIVLTVACDINDELNVYAFQSTTVNTNTLTTYNYLASANQSSFGGADIYSNVLGYVPGNIFTTYNGITLRSGVDYTASNGTYINLTFNANANDEITVYTFGAFNVANTYTKTEVNALIASSSSTAGKTLAINFFRS